MSKGIHRLIEQQAASRGDALAFNDETRLITYRDLNGRANTVARALVASGFKRGAVAALQMPRSVELAITMLAVLKAGGAYMNVERDTASWPSGVSIVTLDRSALNRSAP